MPLYEYRCEACGSTFEKIVKFSDPPLEVCQKCGKGPITKLISSPAIQFKGTGWYITDYAKKSSTDSGSSKPGADKSDKSERAERSEKAEKAEKADKADKSGKGESTAKTPSSTTTDAAKSSPTKSD
jgi:putative FmdB family regulatory protein